MNSVRRVTTGWIGGHAEHHGVAHHIVHLVALEHGLHQRERRRRFRDGLDTREQLHACVTARRGYDAREELLTRAR